MFDTSAIDNLIFGTSQLHKVPFLAGRLKVIECAINCGITHFDTAPMYGEGIAECVLGMIGAKHSERLRVSSKVGYSALGPMPGSTANMLLVKSVNRLSMRRFFQRPSDSSRFTGALCEESVQGSLLRLNGLKIDTMFLHEPSIVDIPIIEKLIPVLERYVLSGDVGCLGLSGFSDDCLAVQKHFGGYFEKTQLEDSILLSRASNYQESSEGPYAVFGLFRNAQRQLSPLEVKQALASKLPKTKFLFSSTSLDNIRSTCEAFRSVS